MFQLLPCSRCQRTFSVRSEVSESALLKCPNCGNQFRLGELLDAFYAPWVILENPSVTSNSGTPEDAAAAQLTADTSLGYAVGDQSAARSATRPDAEPATGSGRELEESGLALAGPDLELAEEDEDAGISLDGASKEEPKTDWSQFKPITHEEFQRIKRADRSPIWSTLQVVLGGAAAIPVSLLLIWYVLDKDVAGAGPAVARYVPWVVPEKFRGLAHAEPTEPDSLSAEPRRMRRRGESGFRQFDDVLPATENGNPDSTDSAGPEGASGEQEGAVVGTLAETPDALDGAASKPATSEPLSVDPAPGESASASDPPMADVFGLLKRTKEKVDQWPELATAEVAVKREAALSLYTDLASLGAHFSAIPDTPGAPALARDKAQEISRAIKRQPDLIKVIFDAAKAQLSGRLPRPENGWALVCTVGETLDQEDTWRVMVADAPLLPLDVPTIEVPKSVAPLLTSGQRLLLLGTFISAETARADGADGPGTTSSENPENAAPGPEIFRASFSYGL